MGEVVVGKGDISYVRISTRLDDARHFMELTEGLQKKYNRRWRENDRILSRSYHRKARNILEDSAKLVSGSLMLLN
jgi:hypothetical protein